MKMKLKQVFSILVMLVVGGVSGYFAGYLLADNTLSGFDIVVFFFAIGISFVLHVIIHEAGHGIFGQLTGYKMVSYRIFSFMWVWQQDGTIVFRRLKVPGTLGQCLMAPPPYQKGRFPFRLYLLGGVLANIVTSSIIGILLVPHSMIAAVFVLTGIFIAVTNVFPMGFNDGMSLKIASSSEEQQFLLYVQFEVNYQLNQGLTYMQLPDSYFDLMPTEPKQTYFNEYQQFLQIARLAEAFDWTGLNNILESLWSQLDNLIEIYQIEVKKELIFSLSITHPDDPRITQLWTDKKVKMSLKQPLMGNKRIEAAYYYFVKHDPQSALDCLKAGKKLVNKAPNAGDAKVEMKLNDWLYEKFYCNDHT
ncbi:hypothetical protein A5821_000306 [Enterococcus sp. 7F3_DIV0205]|uniref:Peptidase M50 domain-containing protein n=1 Tax=Candidatus Enterococcus palustris TaxID=1834189 RepID=A0AAQ3Y6B8_9ENTE|nr:hypothetical protein [Enterococcus sp. 7F3_DIV0205]OTN84719.1 hypothetical protein A5821_000648 [Enterococcus sp. 7F3_DIV0205]